MKTKLFPVFLFFLIPVCVPMCAAAEDAPPVPKIAYIYPAGGKAGTTFEILIGGRQLGRNGTMLFAGDGDNNGNCGIRCKITGGYGPMRINNGDDRRVAVHLYYEALEKFDSVAVSAEQKRRNAAMKQKIEENQKNPAAAEPPKKDGKKDEPKKDVKNTEQEYYPSFDSINNRFAYFDKLKNATPDILETVYYLYFSPQPDRATTKDVLPQNLTAEITIDADTKSGVYDLRLWGGSGLTQPIKFYVDTLPEVKEREPNDFAAKPNEKVPDVWGKPLIEPPSRRGLQEIYSIPIVFNGQIRAGDVDRFSFRAVSGQKLALSVKARALMPYLADAVPGWFQAVLAIFNSEGKKIAESASYQFDPDPVIFFDVPESGIYTAEIRDAIYRGREDFVYRLSVSESQKSVPVFPLAAKDNLPEYFEKETAENTPQKSEDILLPVVINGKINIEGDEDNFVFTGKQGQQIVIDVAALSDGSALDSTVQLLDASGKIIAENDDRADCSGPNIGLETHHADPYLKTVLPSSGKYTVKIFSTISKDGAGQSYRLRISEPLPDFAVYVEPSALNLRNGKCSVKAHIIPKDGFDGDVNFRLMKDFGLFTIKQEPVEKKTEDNETDNKSEEKSAVKKTETKEVKLTFTASPFRQLIPLVIEAVAEVNGKKIVHKVVPADDYEQAFIYHHWVPAKEFSAVYVRDFSRNPNRKK